MTIFLAISLINVNKTNNIYFKNENVEDSILDPLNTFEAKELIDFLSFEIKRREKFQTFLQPHFLSSGNLIKSIDPLLKDKNAEEKLP